MFYTNKPFPLCVCFDQTVGFKDKQEDNRPEKGKFPPASGGPMPANNSFFFEPLNMHILISHFNHL